LLRRSENNLHLIIQSFFSKKISNKAKDIALLLILAAYLLMFEKPAARKNRKN
jgi:uncharacterized membrane protein